MTLLPQAPELYHRWYYDAGVWERVRFLGVPCLKSVSDMWNYQELLTELRPAVLVEFGTRHGGSALFFATILQALGLKSPVLSVDIESASLDARARQCPGIEFWTGSSVSPEVAERIAALRQAHPGPMFAILDSDHRCEHVLAELKLLRPLTQPGDYLIVEDSNINGHPVLPGWGEGPWEAMARYDAEHPGDYVRDEVAEHRFGFTFAPRGFLRRAKGL